MSAFGTKKPLSDLELQLTFPTNFEQAYAAYNLPLGYDGSSIRPAVGLPAGNDLQADYHELKRMEAHRRALNAVKDTRTATKRFLVSHAGYYGMPQAVLSQRVFANPSYGSGGIGGDLYSARRTAPGAAAPFACTANGLHGGVLRSKEGQAFGKRILMNRIAQLDEIDNASSGLDSGANIDTFSDPSFQISQGLPEQAGIGTQVKLTALLQGLVSALSTSAGLNRFTFGDISEIAQLLFRVAPISNYEELSNLKTGLDELNEAIEDYKDILQDDPEEFGADQRLARAMVSIIPRLGEYMDRMIGVSNLSPKERLAASRAAVASLGLTRYVTGLREEGAKPRAAAAAPAAAAIAALAPQAPGGMGGQFDAPARPREEAIAAEAGAAAVAPAAVAPGVAARPTLAEFTGLKRPEQIKVMKDLRIPGYSGKNAQRAEGRVEMYEAFINKPVGRGRLHGGVARPATAMRARFSEDQRMVFGGPEFNYPYADELPAAAPVERPGLTAPRNPMRSRDDIATTIQMEQARQRDAMAPEGMRPAAAKPASAAPVVAAGKPRLKTPAEHAIAVLGKPAAKSVYHPKLRNMKGGRHKGKYHQMPDGTYMTGAKHTKYSKPLKVHE